MYDELIEALRLCAKYGKADDALENAKQAADAIEELQQIAAHYEESAHDYFKDVCYYLERMPKWIPVTERLPEKDGTFITAYSKGGVSQNWYMTFHHGGGKWYQNSEDTGEVTHWMPLPEPPKEE